MTPQDASLPALAEPRRSVEIARMQMAPLVVDGLMDPLTMEGNFRYESEPQAKRAGAPWQRRMNGEWEVGRNSEAKIDANALQTGISGVGRLLTVA